MSESLDQPIRKFNPGTLQSDEEVIRQFVVRNHQLDTVLEVLRRNIDAPSCQSLLVVAPRGRGKTMLMARVAAEIRTNDFFSSCLLPVWFMEESQEIFNIADFWLEALSYLARTVRTVDPDLSQELERTRGELTTQWSERSTGDRARSAVLSAADRLGKRLVLMVENLQALSGDVDEDFGRKLRQILLSEPRIMLLATATTRFEDLDDAAHPFYELFRIVDLEPLSTEECRCLWKVISGDAAEWRDIRPLRILTGGSPRLLVIVAEFVQHRSLRQLMEELVTLIDDHAEYFRSNLEVMPKDERRVFIAVLDLWQPSTAKEVAERARMDIRVVSALLGRLTQLGVVSSERTSSGTRRMYAATERLYGIYYKLRRERDEAATVHHLIRFMVAFYRDDELAAFSSRLRLAAMDSVTIYEGMQRAIVEAPQFVEVLGLRGIVEPGEFAKRVEDRVLEARTLSKKAVRQDQIGRSEEATATWDELIKRYGGSDEPELQQWVALALVNKGENQDQLGETEAAIATYDEVIKRFAGSDEPRLQDWIAMALINKGIGHSLLGESEAAIADIDEVIRRFASSDEPTHQEWVARALEAKGETQEEFGQLEAAIATWEEVIQRFGDCVKPDLQEWVAKALVGKQLRQMDLGHLEASIATCDELIERFGSSDRRKIQDQIASALAGKGATQEQLGQLEAAIATWDDVARRFGNSYRSGLQKWVAIALVNKAVRQGKLGDFDAAIVTGNEVIERYGDSEAADLQESVARALVSNGAMHYRLKEFWEADEAWDEVIERFGDNEAPGLQEWVATAMYDKGVVCLQLGESEAAIATWNEVLERFGGSEAPELQVLVAKTLVCNEVVLEHLGELEAASETRDEVLERFGSSEESELQQWIAKMMVKRGLREIETGRAKQALCTCDELEDRFDALADDADIEYGWWSGCLRTRALCAQDKRSTAAMDLFRQVYAALVPRNETMVGETLSLVTDLIAIGVSAHQLLEVLLSDEGKADALQPLVVALRELVGEHVRTPKEIGEIAADIRKQFEVREKILQGRLPTAS